MASLGHNELTFLVYSSEEKSMISEESAVPDKPEIAVFAAYSGPPKYPVRVSLLGEMVSLSGRNDNNYYKGWKFSIIAILLLFGVFN